MCGSPVTSRRESYVTEGVFPVTSRSGWVFAFTGASAAGVCVAYVEL